MKRSVIGHLRAQMKFVATFLGQRQTNEAAGMARHEVDGLRRNFLGRANDVAFVLAVFIIDDDNHAPIPNIRGGTFD